jgi:hypothetical protein
VVEPGESGALTPSAPAAGANPEQVLSAATQLRCVWRDPGADTTYLEAKVATVDPAVATTYMATLPGAGYTCSDTLDGQKCQIVKKNQQYPVDDADTVFLRDNVYVHVSQSNFTTNGLLGSIVSTIWG